MGLIENKNKKTNENEKYYFASYINSEGYVFELLLTEKEFNKATARADKNREDIPENYIVLQGYKKELR